MRVIAFKFQLAAALSALVIGQPAHAAQSQPAPSLDPLVALSMLGTAQSRAPLCGNILGCRLQTVALGSTAATSAAAAQSTRRDIGRGSRSEGLLTVLAIGGAMILLVVLAVALTGDDEAETPISPS